MSRASHGLPPGTFAWGLKPAPFEEGSHDDGDHQARAKGVLRGRCERHRRERDLHHRQRRTRHLRARAREGTAEDRRSRHGELRLSKFRRNRRQNASTASATSALKWSETLGSASGIDWASQDRAICFRIACASSRVIPDRSNRRSTMCVRAAISAAILSSCSSISSSPGSVGV